MQKRQRLHFQTQSENAPTQRRSSRRVGPTECNYTAKRSISNNSPNRLRNIKMANASKVSLAAANSHPQKNRIKKFRFYKGETKLKKRPLFKVRATADCAARHSEKSPPCGRGKIKTPQLPMREKDIKTSLPNR
ncbi:MAG: hypothetical protein DBX55_00535 [Verrucomicrobia bacterium]|nr:MAG: hypothetical protein DBX55_00535 [Verrucomicrobiota bacterium]